MWMGTEEKKKVREDRWENDIVTVKWKWVKGNESNLRDEGQRVGAAKTRRRGRKRGTLATLPDRRFNEVGEKWGRERAVSRRSRSRRLRRKRTDMILGSKSNDNG